MLLSSSLFLETTISMTIKFYDENSQDFFDRSVLVELSLLYDTLAKFISDKAHILDAGCGSGRDSKVFLEQGYKVSAFDASEKMVALASEFTGLKVKQHTFAEMDYGAEFDVVWANASLLHVPYNHLPDAFERIINALKKHGIFYASFKVGESETTAEDGRHFTNFNEARLRDFIAQFPELLIEELISTPDSRPGRPDWLNVYMRRVRG